jgi:hypothetical protein
VVAVTLLQEIQRLQYTDREAAQELLKTLITDVFSVNVREVVLRPLAVSLNSFNGFVTLADGQRLFFKSHVEPGGVIDEYYNSALLEQADYPIIMPVMASTEPGQQILLYEVVEDQSVFDAAWQIERRECEPAFLDVVTRAQHAADEQLFQIYASTLVWQEAPEHGAAPVHQLFHHRLTRGRFDEFYGDRTEIRLPGMGNVSVEELLHTRWEINGIRFEDTLADVVARATRILKPEQAGPAIVGHGDAHNGNVFLRDDSMVYFDPAFAGRHDPLLDLAKPLYHNVHATWMYFPAILEHERGASLRRAGDVLVVTYEIGLPAVRQMFWESKTKHVLIPLLQRLRMNGWLREDWRTYLQCALACCPLLTMNLADSERFPPAIALLGMAHVLEMGGRTVNGPSRIECWLDEVETTLCATM